MVGGGIYDPEKTYKTTRECFHPAVPIIELEVKKVDAANNLIITEDGRQWTYDHLVISTGNKLNWAGIKGAEEALEDESIPVGSIYWIKYAKKFNRLAE